MIPIDLTGKTAVVTGVADNVGFGWHIAKALQASGAKVVLACHPRVIGIVNRFLTGDKYAESRTLQNGDSLKVEAVLPCDVGYDVYDDISEEVRSGKGYKGAGDVSITGFMSALKEHTEHIDILIHSVAFSPEVSVPHIDVSRHAYLTAMSISSYSLVALTRAALPMMKDRNASIVGLTYGASTKVVSFYGGGMAAAKAALECDARFLSFFAGEHGHRVNLVSPGAYASRAARSIGDIQQMIDETAARSPLRESIDAVDVANATLFYCSDLSKRVTGTCLFVDAGFHAMGQ